LAAGTAVETKPKRVRKVRPKAPPCANCETPLVGAFCHACGQKAHLHDKLKHLVEEFAEGIAHFDGRLWRTLPLLALNPGRLSHEWLAGKRVRYVAPLHLFLFAVFLLFLIPNFTDRHYFDFSEPATLDQAASFTITEDDGTVRRIDPADAEALRNEMTLSGPVVGVIDLVTKLRKNPQYYGYKMEALAYKLSFVTVPISVAILWLMYAWRRRFSLYHHAVVSLYGLGFVALLLAFTSLFTGGLATALNALVILVAPIHAAVHLRGAYGRGWFQTILRTLVLSVLTVVAFVTFLMGVAFLGLTG
jgi:hypothetical protein